MPRHESRRLPGLVTALPVAAVVSAWRHPGADDVTLPDLSRTADAVRIDPRDLDRYRAVCGFTDPGAAALSYPHVLGFRLGMRLFTHPRFPFPPIGLLHTANRIVRPHALPVGEPLRITASLGALDLRPRGVEFAVHTRFDVDGEPVWWEISHYLYRTRTGITAEPTKRTTDDLAGAEPIRLPDAPAGLGRRYARASGDYNPIHLHRFTAAPFGLGRPIAHGMWSLARCLAAVQDRLPADNCTVDARFRAPLALPARDLAVRVRDGRFELAAGGKPVVTGAIGADATAPPV